MEDEKRVCKNCQKEMQKIPNTPTYACAWCKRQETESGTVLVKGNMVK